MMSNFKFIVTFCMLLALASVNTLKSRDLFAEQEEHKTFRVPSPRFRLSEGFVPSHYDVKVRPILENVPGDLPQWTAPGEVTIYGTCSRRSNNITLHSQVVINQSSVTVTDLTNLKNIPVSGHEFDDEKTFYTIQFGQELDIDVQYSIHIEYVATIYTSSLEGMYRNHYDDPLTGETKYSIATQLQSFGARRVFPCLDEPAIKATFGITLGRRLNYSSISNSPLIRSTPIPDLEGWFWDEYSTTVTMSTYLVAIIIGDFEYDEATPGIYNKPVRTYGPKHLISQGNGEFASDVAAKTLLFFDQFFNIEYSMPKMDSIGIQDFAAGAMENYGLNIYKENRLLYGPTQNNERDRRGTALLLNHELAHQWSGNLVTCDWWTMTWLNEGFATYLSYLGMEYTNPEFETQKALQYERVHVAMRNDILEDAHPTVLPDKGSPWETMNYNYDLVYSKGAALLRMIEGFLTLETLQKGLQTYMQTFSFKAANQDQLFEILTFQANTDNRLPVGVTVKDIMDTWTLQKGFPLVKVTISEDRLLLTQEQYKPDNESLIYYVPIAIATESELNLGQTLPQYWLYQQENGIQVNFNTSDWVVINSGGTGYYRVEYDDVLVNRLQNQLSNDHKLIALGSRTQILDDYFTFAFDHGLDTDIEKALNFTQYLGTEIESSAWNVFFYHMDKPRRMLLDRPDKESFKSYLSWKISGAFNTLINSEVDLSTGATNIFYSLLLDWSVALNNEEVRLIAMDYYDQWNQTGSNLIPPILAESIHCAALRDSPWQTADFALNSFMNETETSRLQLIKGMACRSDYNYLRQLLGPVTGLFSYIPDEYADAVISAVTSVYQNFGPLIPILDTWFDDIVLHQGSPRIIAEALAQLCVRHSTDAEMSYINTFMLIHDDDFSAEDKAIVQEGAAVWEKNRLWMSTIGTKMSKWFDENQ